MKTLFLIFLFLLPFVQVCAQNIMADTTQANTLAQKAKAFQAQGQFDSTIVYANQAAALWKRQRSLALVRKKPIDRYRSFRKRAPQRGHDLPQYCQLALQAKALCVGKASF